MFKPNAHIYRGAKEDQVIVRIRSEQSAILTITAAISLKNDLVNFINNIRIRKKSKQNK